MIKKLIILLTLLMVVRVDAATTVYGPAQTGTQALAKTSTESGFERRSLKTGMMTDGSTILLQFGRRQSTSLWVYDLITSDDFGSTWNITTNFMEYPTNLQGLAQGLYAFGDSSYMTTSNNTTAPAFRIAMYRGINQIYLDSQILATAQRSSGNIAAVVPLGTTAIFGLTSIENATADTSFAFNTDGVFSEAVGYVKRDSTTTITTFGLRVPFTWSGGVKGGILYYDQANNDVFWADSATGFNATLNNNWLNMATLGGYESWWMCQIKDSLGMVVYQRSIADGSDALDYKTFHITGTATGSPAMAPLDSGQIIDGSNTLNGFRCTPTLSTIWGTDSVVCYYKQFEGGDRLQPYIAYKIWDGSAWGSEQTYYNPSTATDTIAYMQSPPRIYNISGTIKQMVAYADSVGTTNNDTLRIALGSFETGAAPAAPTSNTVIKGGTAIRGAVIR